MFKDRSILLLATGQTLVWAALFYSFPALLLRWEEELGWSKAELSAAITLAVLISASCSPFTGRIIDRGLGPQLMLISSTIGGIGLLLLSKVTLLWQFYAVWVVIGAALAGCLYEPCFAIVTRSRGRDAKRGIIWITLIAGFASTISFPTLHFLADLIGWRSAVALFGLVVIIFVAPILWLGSKGLEEARITPVETSYKNVETNTSFLKNPIFWCIALGFAFLAVVHGATLQHLLPILNEKGLSSGSAVLAASFIGPMQVFGRLVMMTFEKYTTHHVVTLVCFVGMGISIMLLRFSDTSLWFIPIFVLLFASTHGTTSILRPLIARDLLGGHNFGAKTGALALPYLVGAALAPYLAAVVWGVGGYALVLELLVGVSIIALALYYMAARLSL